MQRYIKFEAFYVPLQAIKTRRIHETELCKMVFSAFGGLDGLLPDVARTPIFPDHRRESETGIPRRVDSNRLPKRIRADDGRRDETELHPQTELPPNVWHQRDYLPGAPRSRCLLPLGIGTVEPLLYRRTGPCARGQFRRDGLPHRRMPPARHGIPRLVEPLPHQYGGQHALCGFAYLPPASGMVRYL